MKSGWYFLVFAIFANVSFAMDFTCLKTIEDNALYTHCENKIANYPEPIHYFIPKNLNEAETVIVNIHFQGHNINGFTPFKNFGNLLINSEKNAIIIAPISKGNCDTFDSFFALESRGSEFLLGLVDDLKLENYKVSLSGHSGAYRVLRTIFAYKNFSLKNDLIGVGLFDATYSDITSIVNFAKTNSDFIFYNSYVGGANGTADEISLDLKKRYQSLSNFRFFELKTDSKKKVIDQHFELLQIFGIEQFLKSL